MHALVATSVAAAASAGINKRGRPYAFELLGYDFMVDDDLRVWLIEVRLGQSSRAQFIPSCTMFYSGMTHPSPLGTIFKGRLLQLHSKEGAFQCNAKFF